MPKASAKAPCPARPGPVKARLDRAAPSGAKPEGRCAEGKPPRLCRADLEHPELWHRRLVDWLLTQH